MQIACFFENQGRNRLGVAPAQQYDVDLVNPVVSSGRSVTRLSSLGRMPLAVLDTIRKLSEDGLLTTNQVALSTVLRKLRPDQNNIDQLDPSRVEGLWRVFTRAFSTPVDLTLSAVLVLHMNQKSVYSLTNLKDLTYPLLSTAGLEELKSEIERVVQKCA